MFYRKNVPRWERALRVLVGLCIMAFGFWSLPTSLVSYLIVVTGLTALLTGFIGFCPMCALAGRNLDKRLNKEKS